MAARCRAHQPATAAPAGSTGIDQAWVVSEKDGTWGKAEQVPGLVSSDAGVDSVSCVSAGNCSAGGFGGHQTSRSDGVFVVSQKNGIWGTAQNIGGPGNTTAQIASVSCGSAGNCGAGGFGGIADQAFVASEKQGIVGTAQAVHALRGVSFTVDRGQLVALRGRSGSGKTTLLNIVGGLDDPTAGRALAWPGRAC